MQERSMLRPFRKGHCKINPKSPTSPPFFDFHPKRIDTKHITHTVSPCSTMKTKNLVFCLVFLSAFTIFAKEINGFW